MSDDEVVASYGPPRTAVLGFWSYSISTVFSNLGENHQFTLIVVMRPLSSSMVKSSLLLPSLKAMKEYANCPARPKIEKEKEFN